MCDTKITKQNKKEKWSWQKTTKKVILQFFKKVQFSQIKNNLENGPPKNTDGVIFCPYLLPPVACWTPSALWLAPLSSTSLAEFALSQTGVGTVWWSLHRSQTSKWLGFSRRDAVKMLVFWTVWYWSWTVLVFRFLWNKAAEFR